MNFPSLLKGLSLPPDTLGNAVKVSIVSRGEMSLSVEAPWISGFLLFHFSLMWLPLGCLFSLSCNNHPLLSQLQILSLFSPQPTLANSFKGKVAADSELNEEWSPLFDNSILLVLAFATPDDVCIRFHTHIIMKIRNPIKQRQKVRENWPSGV